MKTLLSTPGSLCKLMKSGPLVIECRNVPLPDCQFDKLRHVLDLFLQHHWMFNNYPISTKLETSEWTNQRYKLNDLVLFFEKNESLIFLL